MYLLTDNGRQFFSKFFAAMTTSLGTKHLPKTAHYLQTNRQVKIFNRTVVAPLQYYIAEHLNSYNQYEQLLTYAYNAQVYGSTRTRWFSLVFSCQPSCATKANLLSAITDDMMEMQEPNNLHNRFMRQLGVLHNQMDAKLARLSRPSSNTTFTELYNARRSSTLYSTSYWTISWRNDWISLMGRGRAEEFTVKDP